MMPSKYPSDRFQFGKDQNGNSIVYRRGEVLAQADDNMTLEQIVDELHILDGAAHPVSQVLTSGWVVLNTTELQGGPADPVVVAAGLRNAGVTAQVNHVYFVDTQNISSTPNMFGPNMFGPNMFGPNMFGPNMFGPNMFGPNMFGADGHRAGGCHTCPTAPGSEDEARYIPELQARPACAPFAAAQPVMASKTEIEVHVLDVRETISASERETAQNKANDIKLQYDLKLNGDSSFDERILNELDTVPGRLVPAAIQLTNALKDPSNLTGQEKVDVFDQFKQEPTSFGLGTDTDGDEFVDPATNHMAFIQGVIGQVIEKDIVHTHAIAGTLGDVSDSDLTESMHMLLSLEVAVPPIPRLLSLSLSGYTDDDKAPPILAQAVSALQDDGWLIIAAAGNNASCRLAWPAALPKVVSVAAYGPYGPAWFSNFGPWVDACGPGVNVLSDFPELDPSVENYTVSDGITAAAFSTGWATWSGTSFSAPYVAAQLAASIVKDLSANGTEPPKEFEAVETYDAAVYDVILRPNRGRIYNYGTVVNGE